MREKHDFSESRANPYMSGNDFLIKEKRLPIEDTNKNRRYSQKEIAEARAFVDKLAGSLGGGKGQVNMLTDDEMKQRRLASRGLAYEFIDL